MAKTGRTETWGKQTWTLVSPRAQANTWKPSVSKSHLQPASICLFNTASCLGEPGRACMCQPLDWPSTETLLKGSLKHSHDFEICCFITYPLRSQEEDISHRKQPGNAGELHESEHNYPFWKLVLVIRKMTPPPLTAPGKRVSVRRAGRVRIARDKGQLASKAVAYAKLRDTLHWACAHPHAHPHAHLHHIHRFLTFKRAAI